MYSGILYLETHSARPGLVRMVVAERAPPMPDSVDDTAVRRVRYVARFNDLDAAQMHLHELLRRQLVDLDNRLYRVPLEQAVAAAESLGLRGSRLFIDPALGDARLIRIEELAERLQRERVLKDKLLYLLGYTALAVGVANALVGFFS